MEAVSAKYSAKPQTEQNIRLQNAEKLENSFAGHIGKVIEPAIEPLGYDWKIGIALITSFAAREVFVGTLSTIYAIEGEGNERIVSRLRKAKRQDGKPVYTLGTIISLLLFYSLALQCMSTLAVMKKETGTWKWPLLQFLYMGALAYILALIAYQTIV
jgi:ferrous iron transport protein B